MQTRIRVLVYKEDATLWYSSAPEVIGVTRTISCNHQYLGLWGINMQSEEVPIPSSTVPPGSMSPPISEQGAQSIVQVGNVWVDLTYFGDDNFKVCVKVKDMDTGIVSFIDADDYTENIPKCNLASFIATPCGPIVEISGDDTTQTSIAISWNKIPGATGFLYENNTNAFAPTTGTYLPAGTDSINITGLSANTSYSFWIRPICPGDTQPAFTRFQYTTLV